MNLKFLLPPNQLLLSLPQKTKAEALQAVTSLLQKNPNIHYFPEWYREISEGNFYPIKLPDNHGVVISHLRSSGLDDIVMAAGRSQEGIPFETETGELLPVNLLFVIGLPSQLNNDYLRLLGSIARACSTKTIFESLLTAPSQESFVECLYQAIN